jgi:hypothetical protein
MKNKTDPRWIERGVQEVPQIADALKALSSRKRNKNPIDLYRLQVELNESGHACSKQEMQAIAKRFEEWGWGKRIEAPVGENDKFLFNTNFIPLAEEAYSLIKNQLKRLKSAPIEAKQKPLTGSGGLLAVLEVRNGIKVKITGLPHDVTHDEIDRLAQELKDVLGS